MEKNINPLKDYSVKRAKEFNLGVKQDSVKYLVKMNNEVNEFVINNNLKTKDYKKFREEQIDENN